MPTYPVISEATEVAAAVVLIVYGILGVIWVGCRVHRQWRAWRHEQIVGRIVRRVDRG